MAFCFGAVAEVVGVGEGGVGGDQAVEIAAACLVFACSVVTDLLCGAIGVFFAGVAGVLFADHALACVDAVCGFKAHHAG